MEFHHKAGGTMEIFLDDRDVEELVEYHYRMQVPAIEGSAPKVWIRTSERFKKPFAAVGDGGKVDVFLLEVPSGKIEIPNEDILADVEFGESKKSKLFGSAGGIAVSLANDSAAA
jgi:hypothetical protein